jgi:hypothetical protein
MGDPVKNISIFYADRTTNMAANGKFLFGIGQLKINLIESIYGRFCIKFHQNKMTGERHRLNSMSL